MSIKVLSIDMFQTLADLGSRKYLFYRMLLGEFFTPDLADHCWRIGVDSLANQFAAIQKGHIDYVPLQNIFMNCFQMISIKANVRIDPKEAAKLFALQHAMSPPFDDAIAFLKKAGAIIPICLSSDTDEHMLGDLKHLYPFDKIFTSEKLRAYKLDSKNRFFNAIVDHYELPPVTVLHVGDARPDVIGASRAGMTTCWLNRNGLPWRYSPQPDYEVSSLREVLHLIISEVE